MKHWRYWQLVLRVCLAAGVLLSGLLLTPYVALPSERISWQRFAGLYMYPPESPTPSPTPTAIATTTTTNTTTTATATETATTTATPTEGATVTTVTPSAATTATGSLPDLTVSEMAIALETGNSCGYSSTALGLRVTISNIGAGAVSGAFNVLINDASLRVDGAALPPGGTVSLWVSTYRTGVNTAVVDAQNEIEESNEANNTLSEQLPIPTLPPTCTVTSVPNTTATTSTPATTTTATASANSSPTPTGTATTTGVTLNYTNGQPGSFFNVVANNFAPNSTVAVSVNGQTLGTLTTDAAGVVRFTLSTVRAAPGVYTVTIALVAARATATTDLATTSVTFQITLDTAAPLRAQQDVYPVIALPFTTSTIRLYLPIVIQP